MLFTLCDYKYDGTAFMPDLTADKIVYRYQQFCAGWEQNVIDFRK
jgi:hypothetical protein